MTLDLGRFTGADEEFVVRVRRDDLPGLLRKRLEVPQGSLALVRGEGGELSVLQAGAETADVVDGLIVKDRCRLELEVDGGASKDDLTFAVALGLDLRPRSTAIDLGQLEQTLLKEASAVGRREVTAFFEPYVRDAVRFYVRGREAEALATTDQRAELEAHLRKELEKPLFEAGLELQDVLHPSFHSEAWDERRREALEHSGRQAAMAREKELLELKKQIDLHAVLADIEVRDEADRARKERRLAQYEQLRTRMGDDDVKALVMMLDDDTQRARLIRELIEKDMPAEQRARLELGEMEDRVEGRLIELQQKLAQLTGAQLQARESDPITRRVLCVVGKRVLAFDPKTNLHPEVPKEVYETESHSLGYLRSARVERIGDDDFILAGAQRGVYKLHLQDLSVAEFPYGDEPRGKGGANSVAYFDGRIYATHSEVGLTEWPLEGGAPRPLCEDVTRDASAIRGVVVSDGVLYFSAGNEVLALDLATGTDRPTRYRGSDDSITAFVVLKDELVAGNRSGKLFRWSLDDPGSAEAFNVIKKHPIYMLRHATIAGQGFYIVGSKDFTVTAAEPRKDLYREYHAREEVRWVDGAADFIVGVSRSGYKVFAWDALHQSEPKLTIRVSDKVQDLFVHKQLPRATV